MPRVRYRGGSGVIGRVVAVNAKGQQLVQWPAPWAARWFAPSSLEVVTE